MTGALPTRVVWRRHPGYLGAYALDVIAAFSLGLTALFHETERFSAPAYANLRETSIEMWGALLVLGGVLLLVGAFRSTKMMSGVLTVGAIVYGTIAIWFGMSAWADPAAAWWGTIFCGVLCGWHVTQANEYRRAQP